MNHRNLDLFFSSTLSLSVCVVFTNPPMSISQLTFTISRLVIS